MNCYLLGEKINTGGRRVDPARGQRVYSDPARYWHYAMAGALGGFWWYDTPQGKKLEDTCWKKLRMIIGDLEVKSFNMLVPSVVVGSWSTVESDRAADCVVTSCPRPGLLICCGTRVAKAIWRAGSSGSYPVAPGIIEEIDQSLYMARIPHPSPRNNSIWAKTEIIADAKKRFDTCFQLINSDQVCT